MIAASPMAASKKPTRKPTPKPAEPRGKSLLTETGDAAQRALLLKTLKAHGWNLTATAEALRLSAASSVIRAIHNLGLTEEYEAARDAGKLRPGPRSDAQK